MDKRETSWQKVGNWYDSIVGDQGSYYHKQIILPNVLRLLELKEGSRLIDLACGQGVLSRHLPPKVEYLGLDAAKDLIKMAQKYSREHRFLFADVTRPFPIAKDQKFSHAACILALQNIEHPAKVFEEIKKHLDVAATFVLVMNHPCFRIPRQSSWGFDEASKLQYRRLNSYMSEQKIPITTHPGKQASPNTWSFHHPLSHYFAFLNDAGFVVETVEEWCSDKESQGKARAWENRARKEFPLFLAIKAKKL